MDKENIETIAESFDYTFGDEIKRIKNLPKEERKKEYYEICDKIDQGRKEKKIGRFAASGVKSVFKRVYKIHPNDGDLELAATGAILLTAFGAMSYFAVIKPLIEYFSK